MTQWRIQCLNCSYIVQGFEDVCYCSRVLLRNGQRTWPYFPIRDVSIWKTSTGKVLPQSIVDYYFNLSREPNKTSTNTKTRTLTSSS